MKKFIFSTIIFIIITACSNRNIIDNTVPTQRSNLTVGIIKKNIIEGVTTQNDIINLFGAPNIITTNSKGNEVWNYSKSNYQSGSEKNETAWSLLLLGSSKSSVLSSSSTASFNLIIIFNPKGIVESYRVVSASF